MALFFVGSRSLLHRPGAPPSTSIPICRLPTPRPQPTGDKNSRIQPKPIIFCCCHYHRPSIFIHHRSSVFRFHFQRQRQNLINQTFSHWASSISLTSPIITQPREPSSTKAITSSTSGQSLSLIKSLRPYSLGFSGSKRPYNHWTTGLLSVPVNVDEEQQQQQSRQFVQSRNWQYGNLISTRAGRRI